MSEFITGPAPVERLSDAEIWESLIPRMGYMALLRNLRNFDQAGVSDEVAEGVCARLASADEVARSMQFPYRFLSAWKATASVRWASALEKALAASVSNVPEFSGRTLVLVDTSGSMQSSVAGERSQVQRWEAAALFGAVVAARAGKGADLAIYATGVKGIEVPAGGSVLRFVESMQARVGSVGHGTNTWGAIQECYDGQDRIVVLTDEQSHDSGQNPGCFMHFINLAGYRYGTAPADGRTFAYGGFTDAMFKLLPIMEAGSRGVWPWEG